MAEIIQRAREPEGVSSCAYWEEQRMSKKQINEEQQDQDWHAPSPRFSNYEYFAVFVLFIFYSKYFSMHL